MTTLGGTVLTLADIAKRTGPDNKISQIIEILDQTNEMIQDMTIVECNDGDSHETTIRTGLPEGTWRRYNQGVQPSKSTTAQVRCGTGMLEMNSPIDRDLAEKGGNTAETRASEATAAIMGLNQQMAAAVLYDDERVNVERITGIMAHYGTVDTNVAASAENVIDAEGVASDNASILLVVWHPNGVTGLVPKGLTAGLSHEDKGVVRIQDSSGIAGATYDAYLDVFKWKIGVCVRDWRQAGRICNIDIPDLMDDPDGSSIKLIDMMIDLSERIGNIGMGRAAWYMPRRVRRILRQQKNARAAATITQETVEGKRVTMFDGIPVRISDALLLTEDRVV